MNSRQRGLQGFFGDLLVVVGLEIQPHVGGPSEVAFEPQGGINSEGALALHDFVDAPGRNADVLGYTLFRESKGNQEILAENLSGMIGGVRFHGFSERTKSSEIARG